MAKHFLTVSSRPLLVAASDPSEPVSLSWKNYGEHRVVSNAESEYSPFDGTKKESEESSTEASVVTLSNVDSLDFIAKCSSCEVSLYSSDVEKEVLEASCDEGLYCVCCGEKITMAAEEAEEESTEEEADSDTEESTETETDTNEESSEEADENAEATEEESTEEDSNEESTDSDESSEEADDSNEEESEEADVESENDEAAEEEADEDLVDDEDTDESASDDLDFSLEESDEEADDSDEETAGKGKGKKPAKKKAEEEEEDLEEEDDEEEDDDEEDKELEEDLEEEEEEEASNVVLNLAEYHELSSENVSLRRFEEGVIGVFANHEYVGTMDKRLATEEVASVFDSSAILGAVRAELSSMEELSSDFGFQPVAVDVELSKVTSKEVDRLVEEELSKIESASSSDKDDIVHSMQIAVAGLNKGVLGENVLATAFSEALASHGVTNPEVVVTRIMERAGEDFIRTVVEKAEQILSKSEDARNTLAEVIQGSSYQKTVASEQDDVNIDELANDAEKLFEKEESSTTAPVGSDYNRLLKGL